MSPSNTEGVVEGDATAKAALRFGGKTYRNETNGNFSASARDLRQPRK